MSEFNIEVEGGKSVRLPTAGKYCDRDIVVTATGGGGGYTQEDVDNAVAQSFADGEKAEYDRFWDYYQNNGDRTNYQCGFYGAGWTDDTYKPKYAIVTTNASGMYDRSYITDTRVPIEIRNCVADTAFARCSALVTIQKLILNGVTRYTSTFVSSSALQNITIEGSIDVNFNISAAASLSAASVQSIIDHLKDLTGATTQTFTVHQTVRNAMTDEQVDEIVNVKNWTLAPAASTN